MYAGEACLRWLLFAKLVCILSSNVLITLYNAFVLPYLTYCCVIWHFCSKTSSDNLQRIQNYAMRVILRQPPRTSSQYCLNLLNWMNLYQHYNAVCLLFIKFTGVSLKQLLFIYYLSFHLIHLLATVVLEVETSFTCFVHRLILVGTLCSSGVLNCIMVCPHLFVF